MDSEKCDKTVTSIPYVVFESCQARNERHIKRLMIIIVILIAFRIVRLSSITAFQSLHSCNVIYITVLSII